MRDLIIERLNILKTQHGDFSKSSMRWRNTTFKDVPIQDVVIENLFGNDLLDFYEKVLRYHYKQM